MIFRIFLWLPLLAFFSSCWQESPGASGYQLLSRYSKQIDRQTGFETYTKGIPDGDPITLFHCQWNGWKNMSFDEARLLMVKTAQGFLLLVNSDQAVKTHLPIYPLTVNFLEFHFRLFPRDASDGTVIRRVSLTNGRLTYWYNSPLRTDGPTPPDVVETYEEALRKSKYHADVP